MCLRRRAFNKSIQGTTIKKLSFILAALLSVTAFSANADVETAQILANKYAVIAKNINPASTGLSAGDGKNFFSRELTIKGKQVACASCHTANPADNGKHIITSKPIRPLAPAANEKRFTSVDTVEKNFTKHCNDIIGRDCTAQEKAISLLTC
jgi:mono/diheme cytochrome c family protein